MVATGRPAREVVVADADGVDLIEFCYAQGWSDGLPVVPPTRERVQAMLAGTHRDPQELLGVVPPRGGKATVEAVAINAVMAGCKPEYLPVVLAAVEAMLEDRFNLNGVQATTFPGAPLVIVHGPIARRIGVNGGANVFGSGFRANATIGRAIRLILYNLGGGVPGVADMSPLGNPSKYTFCIAENEAESPWPPFHTERGFAPDESAVTVFNCDGPVGVNGGLRALADHLSRLGSNNMKHGGELVVVLGPAAAQQLAAEGWSRDDVRRYLFERARAPLGNLWECYGREELATRGGGQEGERWPVWLEMDNPRTMVPVVRRPENFHILVAGGLAAPWCAVLPGWGYMGGLAITRRVRE